MFGSQRFMVEFADHKHRTNVRGRSHNNCYIPNTNISFVSKRLMPSKGQPGHHAADYFAEMIVILEGAGGAFTFRLSMTPHIHVFRSANHDIANSIIR